MFPNVHRKRNWSLKFLISLVYDSYKGSSLKGRTVWSSVAIVMFVCGVALSYNLIKWRDAFLVGSFLWVTIIDFDRFEIPDGATLFLAGGGMLFTWLLAPDLLLPHLLAALAWSGLFASVLLLHRRARGIDGLGWGDVKLIFGIALWLGWDGTVLCVLAAALTGAGTQVALAAAGRQRADAPVPGAIAFGPFLCLSAGAIWLAGAGA